MSLSISQQRALALLPKFTGFMSMIGSGFVVTDVVRDKKKLSQTYSRLVLGFSSVDFLVSFAMFLSTWPIPSDSGVLGASGTVASCNYQGFFTQFNITVSWYNLCLAIYYLLVITYKWSDYRVKRIEKWMHIGPLAFGLGTAISSIPLTLYNNSNFWCWISSLPSTCGNTREATGTCERGDHAWIYRWAFFYGPLWFIIFAVSVAMSVVSYSVWAGEKASRKYRNHGTRRQSKLASLTHQVAWQSLCYVLAFYLTWTFPTILRLMQTVGSDVPYGLSLMFVIFTPLQGFLNACVYIRPRYVRFKKLHPQDSFGKVMLEVINMTFPCLRPCLRPCRRCLRRTTESFKKKPSTNDGEISQAFSDNNRESSGYEFVDDYNSVEDAEVLNPAYQLQKSGYRLEVSQTEVSDNNISMEFDGLSPEVPIRDRFARSSSASASRLEGATDRDAQLKRFRSTPNLANDSLVDPFDEREKQVAFDLDEIDHREEMNPQDDADVPDVISDNGEHESDGIATRRGRFAHMVAESVSNMLHMPRPGHHGTTSDPDVAPKTEPDSSSQELASTGSPGGAVESPRKAVQLKVDGVVEMVYEEEA